MAIIYATRCPPPPRCAPLPEAVGHALNIYMDDLISARTCPQKDKDERTKCN